MFSICFASTLLFLWILSSCSWWNILICSSLASRCQTIRLSSRNGVAGLVWLLLTSLCPATNLPCQKQEPSLLVPNRLCVFFYQTLRICNYSSRVRSPVKISHNPPTIIPKQRFYKNNIKTLWIVLYLGSCKSKVQNKWHIKTKNLSHCCRGQVEIAFYQVKNNLHIFGIITLAACFWRHPFGLFVFFWRKKSL